MIADDRRTSPFVDEDKVSRAVAGTQMSSQRSASRLERLAVVERAVDADRISESADRVRQLIDGLDRLLGNTVQTHQAPLVVALERRPPLESARTRGINGWPATIQPDRSAIAGARPT